MKLSSILALLMFVATFSSAAHAGVVPVPELDTSVAGSALTVIGGAVLIIRGRNKK